MKRITVKYEGECARCGQPLCVGDAAMYERVTGIFCVGCEPTDTEDIRAYRQDRADGKASRLEEWADSAEARGSAAIEGARNMAAGIPFGQPILVGHHSERRDRRYRGRIDAKVRAGVEDLQKAERHRARATSIRKVRVKGDAEIRRQAMRDANDARLAKGNRVSSSLYGDGVIVGVYKKSYRIAFDRGDNEPYVCSVDKSHVAPALT